MVAVSLGAIVIEKHFTLERALDGVDFAFSLEPKEFKEMVTNIKNVELAMGEVDYSVSTADKKKRRSLFVVKHLRKGERVREEHIKSIRPGFGGHPKDINVIIGKVALKEYSYGDVICFEDF